MKNFTDDTGWVEQRHNKKMKQIQKNTVSVLIVKFKSIYHEYLYIWMSQDKLAKRRIESEAIYTTPGAEYKLSLQIPISPSADGFISTFVKKTIHKMTGLKQRIEVQCRNSNKLKFQYKKFSTQ